MHYFKHYAFCRRMNLVSALQAISVRVSNLEALLDWLLIVHVLVSGNELV